MKLLGKIYDLMFPPSLYCICCGNIIDRTRLYGLCDECIEKLRWPDTKTCTKCGKILNRGYLHDICFDCRELERHFDRGYTCVRYSTYERKIITDFKDNGKSYYSYHLGRMMSDRMRYENEDIDIVTSVPLHPNREKMRGYNQSELLGKVFAENMPGARYIGLLEKIKETRPMRGLTRVERLSNVKDAFSVRCGSSGHVRGKNICIVDDVFTTGSTLDECSRVLKENGAGRITILSVCAGSNIFPRVREESFDNSNEISDEISPLF